MLFYFLLYEETLWRVCSVDQPCPTLCDPMDCLAPGFPVLHYLPEFAQTHVHWVGDAIQPSHPLLPASPPALSIRVFSNHSALCTRWPKYWSFSFSISSSNGYSGLISVRLNWSDFLAIQRTLKSLPQHHRSKASILQSSAFFMVQLSHQYMTTGKTIALTIWTFVSQVMSLPFNMLSRIIIAFLPRSKHLLTSWIQSSSEIILEAKKIKSATVSIFIPIHLLWSNGTRCHDLSFWEVDSYIQRVWVQIDTAMR